MQSTPSSKDLAQMMRFAQSPSGQQLLTALQESGGDELCSAIAKAAAGDYSQAQKTISAFLATPEAKKLLSQLEGGK
ncbi:MAG: hypothetical protein ACI3V5_06340 [Faecousia sp.]